MPNKFKRFGSSLIFTQSASRLTNKEFHAVAILQYYNNYYAILCYKAHL